MILYVLDLDVFYVLYVCIMVYKKVYNCVLLINNINQNTSLASGYFGLEKRESV
jgi:hypothetical protein